MGRETILKRCMRVEAVMIFALVLIMAVERHPVMNPVAEPIYWSDLSDWSDEEILMAKDWIEGAAYLTNGDDMMLRKVVERIHDNRSLWGKIVNDRWELLRSVDGVNMVPMRSEYDCPRPEKFLEASLVDGFIVDKNGKVVTPDELEAELQERIAIGDYWLKEFVDLYREQYDSQNKVDFVVRDNGWHPTPKRVN